MTLIEEYRIPVPVTTEEYRVGQLYTVVHASREESDGSVAVEILANEEYHDSVRNTAGQYTHKIYHIGGRCPALIKALAPESALMLEEKAWNAFPYCKTVLTNPFLGERLSITVETTHIDEDIGEHENVFGLDPEQIKKRTVRFVDIGSEMLPSEHAKPEYEPAMVTSKKTGRGPLIGDWISSAAPIMCCYKLVTIRMQIFAFQNRLESWILGTQGNYFVKFYKKVFCLLDDWYGMSMDDIRSMEKNVQQELDKKIEGFNLETRSSKTEESMKSAKTDPKQEPNSSPSSTTTQ